jgi:hypothetical protein
MADTHDEFETFGMAGWRAGLAMVRKSAEPERAEVVAIVNRVIEAETELAAWVERVSPKMLRADGALEAWRDMVDGLRRGLLDGAARALGGAKRLTRLPWWISQADFDAAQVQLCRASEALADQEDFDEAMEAVD